MNRWLTLSIVLSIIIHGGVVAMVMLLPTPEQKTTSQSSGGELSLTLANFNTQAAKKPQAEPHPEPISPAPVESQEMTPNANEALVKEKSPKPAIEQKQPVPIVEKPEPKEAIEKAIEPVAKKPEPIEDPKQDPIVAQSQLATVEKPQPEPIEPSIEENLKQTPIPPADQKPEEPIDQEQLVTNENSTEVMARSSNGLLIQKDPTYLYQARVTYPKLARQRMQQGKVIIHATIDIKGKVTEVEVIKSSGYQLLDRAAYKAVKRSRFKPMMMDGAPIQSVVIAPFNFKVEA